MQVEYVRVLNDGQVEVGSKICICIYRFRTLGEIVQE